MTGYFVTGTDTNVGKTHVACALARRGVARGHRVFAFKPIETGCARDLDGGLRGADQELLVAAAGSWQAGRLRGVYRFPLPAAPLVAAEADGATIDLAVVARTAREGAQQPGVSLAIVEGAGGWRVPITGEQDMAGLARELGYPVVIVARAGLGTINHSLLTIEAVEREALPIAGLVLSCRPDDDPGAAYSNRMQIARRWGGRIVILASDPSVLDGFLPGS